MFAKDFRLAARQKLSGNWTTVVLAFLVFGLVKAASAATGIGAIVLTGPLYLGLTIFFLNVSRKNAPLKIETVFKGFSHNFTGSLVAFILVEIYTFLWSLLFVIPGIIKAYSYSMTFYIIADHPEMSASNAIKESRRIMQGNKWRLFCLQFSFIGWLILCSLTFGILALWIAPYMEAATAEFYESIKNGPAVNAPAADAPAANA